MDVSFQTTRLKKECEDFRLASRRWGPENAKAIVQRLQDILAFETLEMLKKSKRGRCHALLGDRKGQFALDLKHGWRLVLAPDYAEWDDISLVTKVIIIKVEDYHD